MIDKKMLEMLDPSTRKASEGQKLESSAAPDK